MAGKLYAPADSPPYHLFSEFNLGHVVFLLPLTKYLAVMFRCMASIEFLGAHAVVAFLSLLSNDGEVKKNLRYSIGGRHAETFEAEHRLVCKMRMDSSDFFNTPACLLMVGVVKNQTDVVRLVVGTHMYAVPQLYGYVPESLSPVHIRIFHEPVEDIFPRLDQWFENAVFLIAVGVSDTEAREQKKALKYGEQPVHAVVLACDGKRVTLRHPDLSENGNYVLHGCCHIRILEKVFDIREKWCNFVYPHGPELVSWWYLKLLIFLQLGKNPCRFFYALISSNQYLRNLNK